MQTKTRPSTRKSQVKENGSSKTKIKADATAARTQSLTEKKSKLEVKPQSPDQSSTEESSPLLSTGMRLICTQANLATNLGSLLLKVISFINQES